LNAVGASIVGAIVAAPIVGIVHLWSHRKKAEPAAA
jgi:hypothetical protein